MGHDLDGSGTGAAWSRPRNGDRSHKAGTAAAGAPVLRLSSPHQRAEPGPENKFATDPIKSREPLPASSLIPAVPSTPQCLSVSQTTSVVSGSMSGSSILVEALRDGRSLVSKANKKSH